MELTEPHSLAQAFDVFAKQYPSDLVHPIFRLLRRIAIAFPILESREAVDGFVWVVGKIQAETVTLERQKLAKRTKDTRRLETPLLRAHRQVLDYYIADVQKNPDDLLMDRIPRWGKEVKTLPVYKGKIDVSHPTLLAWDYDFLKRLCTFVREEVGFDGGKELAIPVSWWPKGEYLEVYIPDDAMPSEAAYRILSKKAGLSVERLRKLIQEGHKLFPNAVLERVQQRWEKAFIDPKLGIMRIPLEDDKDELLLDPREMEFGFNIE